MNYVMFVVDLEGNKVYYYLILCSTRRSQQRDSRVNLTRVEARPELRIKEDNVKVTTNEIQNSRHHRVPVPKHQRYLSIEEH